MSDGRKKKGFITVDLDTRQYLDDFKREIMETLRETTRTLEAHIKELISSTINPIQSDITRLRQNDDDLYDKDLEMRDRVGQIEGVIIKDGEKRLSKLEENKDGRQNNTGVIIGISAAIIALVGLLLFLV